jgi:hypothetical protein
VPQLKALSYTVKCGPDVSSAEKLESMKPYVGDIEDALRTLKQNKNQIPNPLISQLCSISGYWAKTAMANFINTYTEKLKATASRPTATRPDIEKVNAQH